MISKIVKRKPLVYENMVSNKLPSRLDYFLQDFAQVAGGIDYNDIIRFGNRWENLGRSERDELFKAVSKVKSELKNYSGDLYELCEEDPSVKSLCDIISKTVKGDLEESRSRVKESYSDGLVSMKELKDAYQKFGSLISKLDSSNTSNIRATPRNYNYKIRPPYLQFAGGTIDLTDIDQYLEKDDSKMTRSELIDYLDTTYNMPGFYEDFESTVTEVTGVDYDTIDDSDPQEGLYHEISTDDLLKIKKSLDKRFR